MNYFRRNKAVQCPTMEKKGKTAQKPQMLHLSALPHGADCVGEDEASQDRNVKFRSLELKNRHDKHAIRELMR